MRIPGRLVLMIVIGCSLTTAKAGDGDDPSIRAFVDHFAQNGIKLKADKSGWYVVVDPKLDGYDVVIHFRSFPADATEAQMQKTLQMINLAYMLHVPTRVAMSYPGMRGGDPTRKPPKLNEVPVIAKLEKLFKEFRPPEPKKQP